MSQNLFALCRKGKGEALSIYHVPLDRNLQADVASLFNEQENAFLKNIDEAIPYNGVWKPDGNQLPTIEAKDCPEARKLQEAVANPTRYDDIDVKNFVDLEIKALFVGHISASGIRILIQKFTKKQILDCKWTLMLKNNIFNRLTDFAFSLDDKLSAVIEGNIIKFKSFHILRAIIDVGHLFKEATDEETQQFAEHPAFLCNSTDNFLKLADEPTRKMITFITKDGILDTDVSIIKTAAREVNYDIKMEGDKIIMPTEKRELKKLLCFLNGDIYNAPITKSRYLTNSKRKY